MKAKNNDVAARDLLKLLYVLVPLGLILVYIYFSDERDEKLMSKHGIDTKCVMVSYSEGRTGQRGPQNGYFNQFEYHIDDFTHYCYVFTSVKPLPIGMELKVKYLKMKDGNVMINFPDVYKEQYKEYGFNDYGY
jgi:hypothetical protein